MELPEFVGKIYQKTMEHDCISLSAEIAFYSLLSLPSLLFLIISLIGILGVSTSLIDNISTIFSEFIPALALITVRENLVESVQSRSLEFFSLSLLIILWSGSSFMTSLVKALDKIFSIEETRPFWWRKIFSILLLFVVFIMFFLSFFLIFLGDFFLERSGESRIPIKFIQFFLVFVIMTLNATALYRFALNYNIALRKLLPGAVVFSSLWILATLIFRYYVSNFGIYNVAYGPIGGLVVLILWVQITAFCILLGAVVNAVLEDIGMEHAVI